MPAARRSAHAATRPTRRAAARTGRGAVACTDLAPACGIMPRDFVQGLYFLLGLLLAFFFLVPFLATRG